MDVMDAIRQRRAVRDYKPESVTANLLRRLIVAASWAPSAVNEQPWRITVVTDRALLDEISTRAKTSMLETLAAMPRPSHFRETLSDPGFHIFYHAPALIVISAPMDGQWCREDCALAAQNMMLAAHGLGLGTCWIGFAQGWLNTAEGRRAIGLPSQDLAVAPIIVGHPKAALPPVSRKPLTISWIGDIKPTFEEDGGPEPDGSQGLYGRLIHP
jgi:nitroreductase